MTSTSAFMGSKSGIGTTIQLKSWTSGQSALRRARRKPCGPTSTTTGTAMP
jgi:hypothetical protein